MKLPRTLLLAASLLAPLPLLAQAGAFPSKPIKILVPFTAGSGADSSSRFYGEHLAKIFGQAVNVENRPGGSGVVCLDATPDDGSTGSSACDGAGTMLAVKVFWSERGVASRLVLGVRP